MWHDDRVRCILLALILVVSSVAMPSGDVRVFPNPYHRQSAVRGTLKFEGVPAEASVRIYNVRGLKVWEKKPPHPAIVEWNGENENGVEVVPGAYVWVVVGGGLKERGTLIVE